MAGNSSAAFERTQRIVKII